MGGTIGGGDLAGFTCIPGLVVVPGVINLLLELLFIC